MGSEIDMEISERNEAHVISWWVSET